MVQAIAPFAGNGGFHVGLTLGGNRADDVSTHPDATIIQAEREYFALEAEYDTVAKANRGTVPDDEFDRLTKGQVAADDLIALTPARTWAGVAAKARRLREAVKDGGAHDRDMDLASTIVEAAESMGNAPVVAGTECGVAVMMRQAAHHIDEGRRLEAAAPLPSNPKALAEFGAAEAIADAVSDIRAKSIPGAIAQIVLVGMIACELEAGQRDEVEAAQIIQRLVHSVLAVLGPALGCDGREFGRDHFFVRDPLDVKPEEASETAAKAA